MFSRYALAFVLALLAVYGAVKAGPLVLGPSLVVETPGDGATIESGVVEARGTARRTAWLTLDGAPLYPDQSGRFVTALAFPQGTSILTFVAHDRFGRSVTATRQIFVP